MADKEMILIMDFGGQYNQLIARRVREANVYCEVVPYDCSLDEVREKNPATYLDLFSKYAQYFVPKKTSLEGGDKPLDVEFTLKNVLKFDNTK